MFPEAGGCFELTWSCGSDKTVKKELRSHTTAYDHDVTSSWSVETRPARGQVSQRQLVVSVECFLCSRTRKYHIAECGGFFSTHINKNNKQTTHYCTAATVVGAQFERQGNTNVFRLALFSFTVFVFRCDEWISILNHAKIKRVGPCTLTRNIFISMMLFCISVMIVLWHLWSHLFFIIFLFFINVINESSCWSLH